MNAWTVVGSVVAVPTLVVSTLNVVTAMGHETEDVERPVPAATLTGLDLAGSAPVTVVGADVDRVTVRMHVSHGIRRTGHTERVDGSTLVLRSTCPNWLSHHCQVDYRIEVPRDLAVRVDADNHGVELRDLDGDLHIENDNARIVGTDLRSHEVVAQNDNSSVELRFTEAPDQIDVENDNGRITLVVPDLDEGYAVTTQNDNGSTDVGIRTDPDSPHSITVDNDNGRIEVTNP